MRGPQVTPGYLDPRHDRGAMLAEGWLQLGRSRPARRRRLCLAYRALEGSHHSRRPQHRPVVIEEALDAATPRSRRWPPSVCPTPTAGELPMAFVQLRPGATATEGGAARVLPAREIPERAAVPVQVVLIPIMPFDRVRQDLQAGAAARSGAACLRRGAGAAEGRGRQGQGDESQQRSDARDPWRSLRVMEAPALETRRSHGETLCRVAGRNSRSGTR